MPPARWTAYERRAAIDPSEVPDGRADRASASVRPWPSCRRSTARFPTAPAVTRADLAALIGVRLAPLLAQARPAAGGHHRRAQQLGAAVDPAGRARRRDGHAAELHVSAGRARAPRRSRATPCRACSTLIAARNPEARESVAGRRGRRSRTSRPGHLSYPAVSQAVASGVMPLENGAFQLLRPVTGAEAAGRRSAGSKRSPRSRDRPDLHDRQSADAAADAARSRRSCCSWSTAISAGR